MKRWLLILSSVLLLVLAADITQAQTNKSAAKFPQSLLTLYDQYSQHLAQSSALSFNSDDPLVRQVDDHVVVDAVASGDVEILKADLVSLGMQRAVAFGRIVSGELPILAIPAAAALASLRFAQSAVFITNAGAVTSQGDLSMRADVARTTFGVDGTGVKVGVLSDSYDSLGGAAANITSGDLPAAGVQVIQDSGTTDEGRAMLQIVHDVAPGANLAFGTANGGTANFANNIIALKNAGAKVIVDDVIYLAEPMFQDGIIAQAVDTVVAGGAAYFSSAGNGARNAYQVTFVNSGINLGTTGTGQMPSTTTFFAHDFDPGPAVDIFQTVTLPTGTTFVSFQWADRYFSVSGFPGAQTDLDVAFFDMMGNFLFGAFTPNVGNDPVEVVGRTNNSGAPVQVQVAIGKFTGPDPGLMKYVALRSSFVINEFATHSGTIYGHANAVGAEAVGAAAYFNSPAFNVSPPVVETFSSSGTTPILFDLGGNLLAAPDQRADKPGIVAPDGGNTSFFGSDIPQDVDAFPNFFGTSAAAPHVAGVAALLLEARPKLTPAKIYRSLENTAIDMDVAGFDNNTGFGLIQADAALAVALQPTAVDFDADVVSDFGVYRDGTWFILRSSDNGITGVNFGGVAGDIPVPADYDGDGETDIGLYRNGAWYILRSSDNGITAVVFGGVAGDMPVPADYDGDGQADQAVYRNGAWFILNSSGGVTAVDWGGAPQDIPVPADYDGDGKTDVAIYRSGAWFIMNSSGGIQVVGWGEQCKTFRSLRIMTGMVRRM